MTKNRELESLNFDQLDVAELEQRLDMAVAGGAVADGWGVCVDCATQCAGYCEANCIGDCTVMCGADTCGTDCGVYG